MIPNLLTPKETAQALRLSERTLRKLVAEGRLRKVSITSRRIGYLETDVQRLLLVDINKE